MMKLTKTKTNSLLTLILLFHTMSEQAGASHDDDDDEVRILMVGIRGQSRFSAADLLSGRKDGGQEDREIVKTPVITDEARRMMLITGPNLCEEDTERQTFTTALFLSSPGPHAVLMLLNLEDQQSQQCDIVKRAQELLGAEVLQYCIVLLLQNHQEPFTGASREMIDACGGRFLIIRDSEPKPAQRAALVAEIHKLVWLNDHRFYSVVTQGLDAEESSQSVHEENKMLSEKHDNSAGTARWILLILLNTAFIFTKVRHEHFHFAEILFVLVIFTVTLRETLNPDVSVPLNLIVSSTFTVASAYKDFANSRHGHQIIMFLVMIFTFPSIVFIAGLGLTVGTAVSVRTWSDVIIACHAAPGVTFGAHLYTVYSIIPDQMQARTTLIFALKLFLFCFVGVTLSMGFVTVFALFGVKMTIFLLILGFTKMYFHLRSLSLKLFIFFLLFPCSSHNDDDDEVRILMVGIRGQSRFSAADLLSGRKDGGQEDREIVKTPVITDEARRMMLITGPNLCEEDTERQTFITALFLSSPGPHAVLMLLNLEDQQSQQCDIVKRAQELLGAEVLQYCIVLLLQNHQEPFTGASREMIDACGGRFLIIRDSEPKPAQRAALVAEIHNPLERPPKHTKSCSICLNDVERSIYTLSARTGNNKLGPSSPSATGRAYSEITWALNGVDSTLEGMHFVKVRVAKDSPNGRTMY
ncbi:uncharacterized protein LOC122135663 [Cyprinus carpio]|uniref:Uncharacterized protein LOC122135663 n=1 Tax=Cyprinus carpio TaxID=7962 RepID=A0A9Q9VV85_CYPCA|nr:uncharacterized protein LOC122135663 [Cyprinus carpio]